MSMKKLGSILLSTAMVMSLAACGSQNTSAPAATTDDSATKEEAAAPAESAVAADTDVSGSTLEVAVTYTGDQATTFQGLVDKFEEEYGVTVNIAEYGGDYENTLKTRMASNELPDVFQTHGWSLLRYKEYLMNLQDQPWISDYDESALGVIQDDDGAIYVLMISELINGTLVNLDACDAAGINNKFFGIDNQDAAKNQIAKEQYERSLNERRRQEAEIELTYDLFAEQFKGAVYSDEKGYLSPRKEEAWRQFNTVWEDRHKNIPNNYTFKDFMENGVYGDIIMNDMQYEMDRRKHNLVRMYDEIFVKNNINQLSPFYDPIGDYSLKGFKINKNELEIEVPPELVKQDYQNRKNKFFNTVFNNKTDNIPSDTAYLNDRYSNPKPVNINQKLQL